MKKMMIIAAMVSMMLIPAQMEASNKVNNNPKVEYRNDKREFKNRKDDKKFKDYRNDDKRNRNDYKRKPKKPNVAMVKMPAPRPVPPPPAPVKMVYESNPVGTAAAVIGLAALAAIIAN